MKKIDDHKRLHGYITLHHMNDLFSMPDVPFELYALDKGEFINHVLDPNEHMNFLVDGKIRIYNLRDDNSLYQISRWNGFMCLSDMEFVRMTHKEYMVECQSPCEVVSIPLNRIRGLLENDPVFLRFLLLSLGKKLASMSESLAETGDLRSRVLYAMTYEMNGTLSGVGHAAEGLKCSRRQLQRLLKELCDEGIIVKIKKGTYALTEKGQS